jgi:hypothetical protein
MTVRKDDIDQHEIICHEKHHEHDKRITMVETELHLLKETTAQNVCDVATRQKEHEDNFDRTFKAMTQALVNIELKLETFLAGYAAKQTTVDGYWAKMWPILIAVISAGLAYYIGKM